MLDNKLIRLIKTHLYVICACHHRQVFDYYRSDVLVIKMCLFRNNKHIKKSLSEIRHSQVYLRLNTSPQQVITNLLNWGRGASVLYLLIICILYQRPIL